jgi:carbon-monoxide dehydrogenase medium subunit
MLAPFRLFQPETLQEAQDLLLTHGPRARVLAGGTDLLPNLERQRTAAEALVALPALGATREASTGREGLRLGALVTLDELAHTFLIRDACPLLAEVAAQMATPLVRQLATLGGNLCAGLPAADLAVALLALDAEVEVQGLDGVYCRPLDAWLAPWGGPRLEPGELLLAVRVPPECGVATYQRFTVRAAADVVLANVAARVVQAEGVIADARLVVGAHGLRPARARAAEKLLVGTPGAEADVSRAAQAAAHWADLPDDARASRPYRQAVIRALAVRALEAAIRNQ